MTIAKVTVELFVVVSEAVSEQGMHEHTAAVLDAALANQPSVVEFNVVSAETKVDPFTPAKKLPMPLAMR